MNDISFYGLFNYLNSSNKYTEIRNKYYKIVISENIVINEFSTKTICNEK